VIAKVCRRGQRVAGLLYYLFREGRAGERGLSAEHSDPRLVAGWDDPLVLAPQRNTRGQWGLAELISQLEQPLRFAGVPPDATAVYHLVLAAAKDPLTKAIVDPVLSDAQWADIAAEYVHHLGLAPRGDPQGVRWVAVRHAADHVHVVATLARQDGIRVHPHNDFYRAREASAAVEQRYRLVRTAAGDRTGTRPPTRAETERARRTGPGPSPDRGTQRGAATEREQLRSRVRAAAGGAAGLEEFVALLERDGVLVRTRLSDRTPGQVTGYAVALPRPHGPLVFFGGGRLAPDLTLPRLLDRWQPAQGAGRAVGQQPGAAWGRTLRDVTTATTLVRAAGLTGDHSQGADACWATADLLEVAAHAGGPHSQRLLEASRSYERASREPWGRRPPASTAGRALRSAARSLHALGVPRDETAARDLARALGGLIDAVSRLRAAQGRAAQAAAARAACQRLTGLPTTPMLTPPPGRGAAPAAKKRANPVTPTTSLATTTDTVSNRSRRSRWH